jgi:predicted aminopeptidase
MKIHTDTLRIADLQAALRETGLAGRGVYLDDERAPAERGSRKRARRIDFYLVATDGYGRRWANSGISGAGTDKAATYDEWGVFLAELFERDPEASANYYASRRDFEAQTERSVAEWRSLKLPNYDGKLEA